MVTQYPHTATITYGAAATKETNGDLTPGGLTTATFKCRLEPAGGSGYMQTQGGTKVDFTWKVFCEKKTAIVPVGAKIVIVDENGLVLCTDTVKQFSPGQLNCKLWL